MMENELREMAEQSGHRFDYFEKVASTNDIAQDLRYAEGDVVFAERQTAGRGQRGNHWSSLEGENLTFSLVLTPEALLARDQFYLSKAVTLGVVDALRAWGVAAVVKWPNDIYIGDYKVAGILIENDLRDQYLSRSVVGIGLNVNQTAFDPALPNPTSMALATKEELSRMQLFQQLYHRIAFRYMALEQQDYTAIDADYIAHLYRFGEEHPFFSERDQQHFRGRICGVQPTGAIEIEHADGELHSYLFKEVEHLF